MITKGTPSVKPDRNDKRFLHTKAFGLAPLADIPRYGLGRIPLKINQQFDTMYCTGAATESAAEYEEGRKFSFEFQVAAISRRAGAPIVHGADPRMAYEARCDYGCLPDEMTPATLRLSAQGDPTAIADWNKWPPAVWLRARDYVAAGYFWLGSEYEPFDQVREALWNARDDNEVVMATGKWYEAWNQVGEDGVIPATTDGQFFMHEYLFIDWIVINGRDYLVIQNSAGEEFGRGGVQFIDRATMNAAWPRKWGDGTALAMWRKVHVNDINSLKEQWLTLTESVISILEGILFKLRYGTKY